MTYFQDPRYQDPRYQQPAPTPGIDLGSIARTIGTAALGGFAGVQIGRMGRQPRRREVAVRPAPAPQREAPTPTVQRTAPVEPQGMNTAATVNLSQTAPVARNKTISREEWLARRAGVQPPATAPQVQVQRVAEQPAIPMRSADPQVTTRYSPAVQAQLELQRMTTGGNREIRRAAPAQVAPVPAQIVVANPADLTAPITGRGSQGMNTAPTGRLMSPVLVPQGHLEARQRYVQAADKAPTGFDVFLRNNPDYTPRPKQADFPMKDMPAIEMQYGRIEGQGLPVAMEKQGSFYSAQQMGQGRSKPIGTTQLLDEYETAMDSFSGAANDRFMRGNNYNGFEVVAPGDASPSIQPTYNQPRYDADNKIIPLRENGVTNAVYLSPIPQRLSDAIDQNVMATRPSVDVTEQLINSGGNISPSVARTVAQVKAPAYSTAEIPSAYQRPEQAPTQGSYSMQTLEDPAVFAAYEKNYAQAGKELMLPSTAIKDRVVAPTLQQGPGGQLRPVDAEPVLSPYPLALGSTYAKSDLTAKSSIKADLGDDKRLAYYLRSPEQPDLPEYGDRSPDYVKYVPQTQTVGGQYQETMTDAHDVRQRIAAQANNMSKAATIAEKGAARTAYPRNAYNVQVDQTMRPIPGAFENPNLLTPDGMKAARMRQDATEMQHRLAYTDDQIAEAYNRLDAQSGNRMDTQRVLVSQTGADGIARNQLQDLSLEEQLQLGAEMQRQGYARDVNMVPQGYSVTYGEEYPEWERKHQRDSSPRVFGSSAPIVAVSADQTGWGRAVQLR